MVDVLYQIDLSIFYFINHTLSTPILDKFFTFTTEVKHWYIAYIILFFISIFKGGRIGKIAAAGMILLVIVSDQLSSTFLKDFFQRVRPCNALPDVNILAGCTGSYSFPSSHAVNNFAAALFFGKIFPKLRWILISVASLMALSRPYVGVHYPSDVLGGAIIGAILGYIFALLVIRIDNYFENKNKMITDKFERIKSI
ncbi:MAG TPA: phosphatase PAP2 family protein [Melioribacteraceae bacterium]|nr:phosphatase PAP2 family protein [Melioribacteraceae bacterium]